MDEFDDFRLWLHGDIKKIPSEIYVLEDLILCFNKDGTKQPIYWCFNNWFEAIFLARNLGADQPLFAMRSTYGFLEGAAAKKLYTNKVALAYAANMLKLHQSGPIFIGGNCQAALIAEAIAHFLISELDESPILITLEHQPFYSYPGYLVMLFGGCSEHYNPFIQGENPIPKWNKKYRLYSWGILDNASHGEYFIEPAVLKLAAYLELVTDMYYRKEDIISGALLLKGKVR